MNFPRRPTYWYLAAVAAGIAAFVILVLGRELPADELARQHIRDRADDLHTEIARHLAESEPELFDMGAEGVRLLLKTATTWELAEPRRLDGDNYEFTATATVDLNDSGISATLPFIFNVSESAQPVISQSNFDNAEVSQDSSP